MTTLHADSGTNLPPIPAESLPLFGSFPELVLVL